MLQALVVVVIMNLSTGYNFIIIIAFHAARCCLYRVAHSFVSVFFLLLHKFDKFERRRRVWRFRPPMEGPRKLQMSPQSQGALGLSNCGDLDTKPPEAGDKTDQL